MTLLRRARELIPVPDFETRVGVANARQYRRSWWALRYSDGTIVHEWDSDPGSPNGHADWPRLKVHGRQQIRLYCPNGQVPTLGATRDATGRLFQYKVGMRNLSLGGEVVDQQVLAHVVGMVRDDGTDGQCVCYAWEPIPEPVPPVGAPVRPDVPSPLTAEPAREYERFRQAQAEWHAADSAWVSSRAYLEWRALHDAWVQSSGGRLVGPWDDNVYNMKYHNTGRLAFDVLGLSV